MHLPESVTALPRWIEVFRPSLTTPTFHKLRLLSLAWLLVPGKHLITAALVVSGLAGKRHHSAFYRIFSSGTWEPDALGKRMLLKLVETFVPLGTVVHLIVDDTLARHKGKEIFGIACHIDPVLSSKSYKVKAFGHVWVILAIRLKFPFSPRFFALPFLFRLYRTLPDCEADGDDFFTKPQLAAQMLTLALSWLAQREVSVAADELYCCKDIIQPLPKNVVFTGRMRKNAALTAAAESPVKQIGRPRKKGERLPSLAEIYADDAGYPWHTDTVQMYGTMRKVRYKAFDAQWYRVCGEGLIRVVIVAVERGPEKFRVFFQTRPDAAAGEVLEEYSGRWSIEPMNRELKQHLGFGHSGVRRRESVERLVPFVGLMYSVVVGWYAQSGHGSALDLWPHRPWYRHKVSPSFQDMLAAAQRAVRLSGVFDEVDVTDNIANLLAAPPGQTESCEPQPPLQPEKPDITPMPSARAA